MKPLVALLDRLRALREADATSTEPGEAVRAAIAEARELLEAELSHNEISRQLSAAVKAGKPTGNGYYCWVRDVFDDHLIYEEETPTGATLWSQPYTIGEDLAVTLGTATKVKASTVYVPVKESAVDGNAGRDELLERAFSAEQRAAMAKKGVAIPIRNADGEIVDGAYPIPDAAALRDAIQAIGRAKNPAAARAHIRKRAKALGATELIPESWSESARAGDVDDDLDEAAEFAGDVVPLVEKGVRKDGSLAVKLIAPGWGTSGYYSEAVLKRDGPKAFPKGTKMYWDHPTVTEAKERPERSLKDLAAELTSSARYDERGPAGPGLYAEATAFGAFKGSIDELAPHIGTSIRAVGHAKKGVVEGRKGPVIEAITAGESVDFVTQAGAGGQVLQLFEAARGRAGNPASEVDSVSDEELQEARTALEAAQRELEAERQKTARLSEAELLREARGIVTAALGKVDNLPTITRDRLIEAIAKDPPVKDGALDRAALEEAITKTVADEIKYLAEVTRSGSISGMGGAGGDTTAAIKESEDGLEAALGRAFGLSEAEAKHAAAGRIN